MTSPAPLSPVEKTPMERALGELLSYAEDVRNDWSDFDGRDLLHFVQDWVERVRALGVPPSSLTSTDEGSE